MKRPSNLMTICIAMFPHDVEGEVFNCTSHHERRMEDKEKKEKGQDVECKFRMSNVF